MKTRTLAALAVVLLIVVAGVALLYAVRSQEPPTRVFVAPSPTPSTTAALPTATSVATPSPTPRPWSARTPAEVLANLPGDPNFASAIAALSSGIDRDPRAIGRTPSLGTPIYVRGLRPGDANEYLVPVNVGDTTIAFMKIGLDASGLGRLEAVRGWSTTPSFPATSKANAIARGSTTTDAVITAEFVWTNIRGSADELQPFWRLTRASGAVFFLLENGALISATVGLLGVGLWLAAGRAG